MFFISIKKVKPQYMKNIRLEDITTMKNRVFVVLSRLGTKLDDTLMEELH